LGNAKQDSVPAFDFGFNQPSQPANFDWGFPASEAKQNPMSSSGKKSGVKSDQYEPSPETHFNASMNLNRSQHLTAK